MDFERALSIVYAALEAVNEIRPPDDAIVPAPDLVLAGEDGVLDSLGLTTLILSVENRVQEATGQDVALLQESDFEAQLAAFRTPTALAELIVEKSR